jgi:hypothetical protein
MTKHAKNPTHLQAVMSQTGSSRISDCFAVVVVQKSGESFTPREGAATSVVGGSRDEPTAQALVWPFFVVVRHVFAHGLSERDCPVRC